MKTRYVKLFEDWSSNDYTGTYRNSFEFESLEMLIAGTKSYDAEYITEDVRNTVAEFKKHIGEELFDQYLILDEEMNTYWLRENVATGENIVEYEVRVNVNGGNISFELASDVTYGTFKNEFLELLFEKYIHENNMACREINNSFKEQLLEKISDNQNDIETDGPGSGYQATMNGVD